MVTWRGQSAVYTTVEREIMAALPVKEQAFVHLLKSFTDGEIADVETGHSALNQSANHGDMRPADESAVGDSAATASRLGSNDPSGGSGLTFTDPEATGKSDTNPASDGNIPLYTDPDDIPFGKPARRKKTYAVAWSWRKHKIHKTKKRCEERLKVWKAWKERQGFTVIRFASGYLAELDGTREVIQLHEYDRETHERL